MSLNLANRNALKALSRALSKEADYLRQRAIVAEQERGGSIEEEVVDRWVSSFSAAYQAVRAIGSACNEAAEELAEADLAACGTDTRTSE